MQTCEGGSISWDSSGVSQELGRAPEYATSDIINIDEELDLVETEDGYVPASSLPSHDISSSSKRVSIKSPARLSQRPNSLSLSSRSRHSFSSASSRGSIDSSNLRSPRNSSDSGAQSLPAESNHVTSHNSSRASSRDSTFSSTS